MSCEINLKSFNHAMETSHCPLSASELEELLNRKSKRYSIKSFTEDGYCISQLVLQDVCNGGIVTGKLVERTSEEFCQRPWLHHRNLASLIDMVSINDNFSVFVSDHHEKSLRHIIHEEAFYTNSNCFLVKKHYIADILWGLDYLHRNNLCLTNLSDKNILIAKKPNKAIIADFGSLSQINGTVRSHFNLPFIQQPPELRTGAVQCASVAAEMWMFGMMVLEIFTQHKLPWALVDYEPDRVLEMVALVDFNLLKLANPGSNLLLQDFIDFKAFVELFVDICPERRSSARDATSAKFLQSSNNSVILRKTNQKSTFSFDDSKKNDNPNYPSIFQKGCNYKTREFECDSAALKATKSHSYENEIEKSDSNASFKKCVAYRNKTNAGLHSYSQLLDNEDFVNISDSTNREGKNNLQSLTDIDFAIPKDTLIPLNNINSSTKIKSQTSVCSQVEHEKSVSEQGSKTNTPTNEYSERSWNEWFEKWRQNRYFATNTYSPTNTFSDLSEHKLQNTFEVFESCKNISDENIAKFVKERKACMNNNSRRKEDIPCEIEFRESPKNCYNDELRQTTSDCLNTPRSPYESSYSESSRYILDNIGRKTKSMADINDSFQKLCDKKYQEERNKNLKVETRNVSKNPHTLSQNMALNRNWQTTVDSSSLMSRTNSAFKGELSKLEIQNKDFKLPKETVDRKSPSVIGSPLSNHRHKTFNLPEKTDVKPLLVNSPKTKNKCVSDLKSIKISSIEPENFKWSCNPKTQENLRVNQCQFQYGQRSPRYQKAHLAARLRSHAIKEANAATDINISKNKCQSCGNILNVESNISDKNNENASKFRDDESLSQEYWYPARSHFETPILLSNRLSQMSGNYGPEKDDTVIYENLPNPPIARTTAITPSVWMRYEVQKNEIPQEKPGDVQSQKTLLVKRPVIRRQSLVKVEQVRTKHVKFVKKGRSKKSKKLGDSKIEIANASNEQPVVESDDGKKLSKKSTIFKTLFCVRK